MSGNGCEENVISIVHDAVVEAFAASFPDVTVVSNSDGGETVAMPVIWLNLVKVSRGVVIGDCGGHLPLRCGWVARVKVASRTPEDILRLRSLVSRVLTFVDGNRFGVAGNPATFQLAEQASDVADGCGWRVEFEQVVFVGASVWDGEGVVPSEVRVSHSPLIGAAHEDKYVEVTDGFPGI